VRPYDQRDVHDGRLPNCPGMSLFSDRGARRVTDRRTRHRRAGTKSWAPAVAVAARDPYRAQLFAEKPQCGTAFWRLHDVVNDPEVESCTTRWRMRCTAVESAAVGL